MYAWLGNETVWDSRANSSPTSQKVMYGEVFPASCKGSFTAEGSRSQKVSGRYSILQQRHGYLDHCGLSDRRSQLRLTRFRSMAASGPVTARCTQPETVRRGLERFSSVAWISAGSSIPDMLQWSFLDSVVAKTINVFSPCLPRLHSPSLNLGFCSK